MGVPQYLGIGLRVCILSLTGLLPSMVSFSKTIGLGYNFVTHRQIRNSARVYPTTPFIQRIRAFTYKRFGLFPFRSPLLGKSIFLSLPQGTEMFHFPWCTFTCVNAMILTWPVARFGNPRVIALAYSSARLIAVYHVLHRLLVPRHPPCALSNLTTNLFHYIAFKERLFGGDERT